MKLMSNPSSKSGGDAVTAQPERSVETEINGIKSPKKRRRKKPGKKRIVLIVVLVIAVIIGIFIYNTVKGVREALNAFENVYTYSEVELRTIIASLSGNGTLEPADSYTVSTMVSGEILAAGFEEGETVAKDDILFEIDSSDAYTSIERAEISLAQRERSHNDKVGSLADLTVTTPISGVISGISVRVGENVSTQSPIAVIEDTSKLTLTEYYSDEFRELIEINTPAVVSVADQLMSLNGRVIEVSPAGGRISGTGISCFAVTIEVENIGSLTAGGSAGCYLMTEEGEVYPSITDEDGFDASRRTTIYAGVAGKVASVRVHNGETVSAGAVLLTLSSDTLSDEIQNSADSLRDAQLSLESSYDALDNYTIKAPIRGTIVDKYYKQGETADSGKPLCIIYDLSYLTFVMNVDELDISDVKVGQKAVVTAQAVSGREYEGVITKVGINGSTVGGVTTYPVTVRIDETDGLLPGMNVDVSIDVLERYGVLSIPAGAVERGNRVLVKTKDGSTGEGAIEGYEYVEVETGVSDGDFVEVTDGLNIGDSVAFMDELATGNDLYRMMMGMGGGPAVGVMP